MVQIRNCAKCRAMCSLCSRRKWGRRRGARTWEKNGGLDARDEGTPATKTPISSFLPLPVAAKF